MYLSWSRLLPFGYVVLHLALASTDLLDPVVYPFGPPWNPVAGLVLALLLAGGGLYVPLVAVVAALAQVLVHGSGLGTALAEGGALALIYGAAAHGLRHRLALDIRLRGRRHLIRLLAVGVAAAAVHAACLVLSRHGGEADLVGPFLRLAASDTLGVVVLTPFLLIFLMDGRLPRPRLQTLLEGAAIALVLWIDFGLHAAQKFRFFYLLIMPLVWIATRHGLKGATAGIAGAQLGVLVAIEMVPFRDESLTLFQLIMLTLSVTTLLLGSLVSEQRQARAALKDSQARLNAIVEMAPDGVMTIDEAGRIESANPACAQLFGAVAEDLVGQSFGDLLPQVDFAAHPLRTETQAKRRDGGLLPVEVAVSATDLSDRRLAVAVIRDIGRRKADEAKQWEHHAHLARATHLSVSERLATALAHQLNQPLASVIGYAKASQRLLQSGTEPVATVVDAMGKAAAQAERAGEIIRRTREFLSQGEMRIGVVEVADLVEQALSSSPYAGHDLTLRRNLPANLPAVTADPLQVEQVLVNLLQNARDAIGESGGRGGGRGEVEIAASLAAPGWIDVSVADSGPGIAPEIVDKLFTPFSTTKSTGMGMGLFIANSIVEAHGGGMRAANRPQGGAVFSFTLPMATRQ